MSLLFKDIFYHNKVHGLAIFTTSLSILLILIVTLISDSIFNIWNQQLEQLALDVSLVEIGDTSLLHQSLEDIEEQLDALSYYEMEYGDYTIVGCAPLDDYFAIEFEEGHFFKEVDLLNNNNVAVVGSNLQSQIQNGQICLNGAYFEVVGVISSDSENIYFDYQNSIFVPENYPFAYQRLVLFTRQEVNEYLLDNLCGQDNYALINQSSSLSAFEEIEEVIEKGLYGLGYFCLLTSLLSLVNNTLSSLKQRQEEIGIKRSLGADKKAVFVEFLLEIVGVQIISLIISVLVLFVMIQLLEIEEVNIYHCFKQVVIIIIFGIVTGFYPANKASKINVSDCTR